MHNYYFSLRLLLWVSLLICTPIASAFANTNNVNTAIAPSPLSCNLPAPGGLTVTDVTASSISIAWNPVAGASAYSVKFVEKATNTVVLNTTVTATNATATSLIAGTTYRFIVSAICPDGSRSGNESTGEAKTDFIVVDDIAVDFPYITNQITGCPTTFSALAPVSMAVVNTVTGEQTPFNLLKEDNFAANMNMQVLHDNPTAKTGGNWLFTNQESTFPSAAEGYTEANAVLVYYSATPNTPSGIVQNGSIVLAFSVELVGSTLNQINFCIAQIAPNYAVYLKGGGQGRPGPSKGSHAAFNNHAMSASPNPFKDELNIQLEAVADTNGALQLMDAQGRVLRTQTFEAGFRTLTIPTTDLAPGLYFVRMETSKGVSTLKVVRSN